MVRGRNFLSCESTLYAAVFSARVAVIHVTTRKQVPVAFAIMSGRRATDYASVFRQLLDLHEAPCILSMTADFESALWQAVSTVLPSVQLHGCLFHFTQV